MCNAMGLLSQERSNARPRQFCPGTLGLLGLVFAVTMLVVPGAVGQQLRATVVHIEGVPDIWHVTDKDGKIVEVHVPAQSLIDIQTSRRSGPVPAAPRDKRQG